MIFRSIKWRLQAWHALMLMGVLAGFGFTAHQLDRANRLQRIDRELQQRVAAVTGALARGGDRPGLGRPPGPEGFPPPPDGAPGPPERRPPGDGPPGPGSPGGREPIRGPVLLDRDLSLFQGTNAFYFVLWHREGRVLARSDSAPADVPRPAPGHADHFVRTRGALREMIVSTPPGECALAGYDMAGEEAEMRRSAWMLFAAGGAVLLLGLVGGGWIATRAIRPIRDISATASRISAGDLSQRIPASDAENELGQLAGVLNSTFARLEAAFAQQARFTSDAAHELRTPLSVMLTQTQAALNRERSASEYRESLEACQRAAQRMRCLTESLLELARLDAGQEMLRRQPVDLAEIVLGCVDLLRPLAEGRQVRLHLDLRPAMCPGDPDHLAQVLTNLLSNAIHYNRDGGEVRVSTRCDEGWSELSIADTGVGIAEEDAAHIFERFYRADKSRSRSDGRTGLGLAIAKSIVDLHGGHIAVSSKPGAGATFTVRLPSQNRETVGS